MRKKRAGQSDYSPAQPPRNRIRLANRTDAREREQLGRRDVEQDADGLELERQARHGDERAHHEQHCQQLEDDQQSARRDAPAELGGEGEEEQRGNDPDVLVERKRR